MIWTRLHSLAFREALRRLAAQPVASATSVVVLGLALALPLIAAILLRSASAATSHFYTDPHVNLYLALDANDDDVKRIDQALRGNPETASVRFVSKTQALDELRATTHLGDVLASLDRNPLPHAFTVRVRSTEPARLQAAKAEWEKLPKVDQVVADFEWSARLGRWLQFGERIVTGIGLLLAAAVLFVVGHLIRLQVVTQRDEIEVSQLIGATASDVRRRFLYSGALQGFLAGAVALGTTALLAAWVGSEVRALTPDYAADFKVLFLPPEIIAWLLLGTALLGLFGAWLAVDRELRRFAHR